MEIERKKSSKRNKMSLKSELKIEEQGMLLRNG